MKAFKYFDLNNNGTVEPEEFAKAIEKIGIMIPTKKVSIAQPIRGERAHLGFVLGCPLMDMGKILIKNFIYRIWTPSSTYMMLIRVELSTTRNSPQECLEPQPQVDHPRRAAVAATPRTSSASLDPSWLLGELEVSLVSESSSASWMTTTQEAWTCMSSQRL